MLIETAIILLNMNIWFWCILNDTGKKFIQANSLHSFELLKLDRYLKVKNINHVNLLYESITE